MIKTQTVGTTSTLILTPNTQMKVGIIQNNDTTNGVRLSLDGGSTRTGPTGGTGTNPTTALGYFLDKGKEISINTLWGTAGLHNKIYACAVAGTAVLDIVTDDTLST